MLIDGLEYWSGVDYCDLSFWRLFHTCSVCSAYAIHVHYVCSAEAARTHCALTQEAFAVCSTAVIRGCLPQTQHLSIILISIQTLLAYTESAFQHWLAIDLYIKLLKQVETQHIAYVVLGYHKYFKLKLTTDRNSQLSCLLHLNLYYKQSCGS